MKSPSLHTDVLVVGLGPAGSCAAHTAAANGLKVIAIDSRKQIGTPVQCAEFIPLPMAACAPAEGVRSQLIGSMRSELPSGRRVTRDFRGCMIHRDRLDQHLAQQAERAGAGIQTATRLVTLTSSGSMAIVRHAGRESRIHFRSLIAADGPRSTVAQQLGLSRLPVVMSRQYTVRLLQTGRCTDVWLGPRCPGGYAWLFPKRDVAHVGVGIYSGWHADLKDALAGLHHELVLQGKVAAGILAQTGGLIPVGGMREEPVHGNVVFAGDAAGLAHPITGAGIAAAVISGELAGRAVARHVHGVATALDEYREELQDQFAQSLQRAVYRRQELLQQLRTGEGGCDAVLRRTWIAFDEYYAA